MQPLSVTEPGADLTGLAGWVADVITALGSLGVGLLTLLEVVFPPIPSEVVLPFAGYLAALGQLPIVWALIAATAGSVLGAVVLYWVGARLGRTRTRRLLNKVPLMEDDDLDRAEAWFHRHGGTAVFVGRFIPGVRSLVSIPAGIEDMSFWKFLLYTTAGSAGWNVLLLGAGFALGSQWRQLGRYSDWINYGILAAVAAAILLFVWNRRHRIAS